MMRVIVSLKEFVSINRKTNDTIEIEQVIESAILTRTNKEGCLSLGDGI